MYYSRTADWFLVFSLWGGGALVAFVFDILDPQVVYHGPRADALAYFRAVLPSQRCPPFTNPAEWLLDLVSVDYGETETHPSSF